MAHRYDSRTTIFSPEGRLYQVEYAMEAISHAGTSIGFLCTDGVVLAAEHRVVSKLLDMEGVSEKLYVVDDHIGCGVAGITADANILVNYSRLTAQRYTYQYQEQMPVESLVQHVCDLKQGYTQYGGLRPHGVSFLFAGWDRHFGFQLYQTDPSGNYGGWKGAAIGANNQSAQSMMKQEYSDDLEVEGGLRLAIKVLSRTMDSTSLTADKLEMATLTRDSGKCHFRILPLGEIEKLVEEHKTRAEAEQDK